MRRRVSEELQECMREIEKLVESNKTAREVVNMKRKKVGELGGRAKKHVIPLKHAMRLKERRKTRETARRENMESMGIPYRRRR